MSKGKVAPSRWVKTSRVRWGAVLSLPMYPWYFTWVTWAASAHLLAWSGLGRLTDQSWMAFVALPGFIIVLADITATTVITYRRNRHNLPIQKARKERAAKAREARKAQKT